MMEQPGSRMIRNTADQKVGTIGLIAPIAMYGETKSHHQSFSQLLSRPRTNRKPSSGASENCDGIIRVPSGSGYRIMTPFPWRLHEMLEDIEDKKLSWIVSWMPDGKAFQVHSPERFADTIIPMYFRHKRYKSFQRQLYLYGFRSLQVNALCKGAYFHPCFLRDNRSLCRQIVRPKAVGSSQSRSRSKKAFKAENTKNSCVPVLRQTILGGTFEPLSCDRGVSVLMPQSDREEKPVLTTQASQTHVRSVLDIICPSATEEGSAGDFQRMTTRYLLQNLQLSLIGQGPQVQSGTDISSPNQMGETGISGLQAEGSMEGCTQHIRAGPILSMSTGDRTFLNFESRALDGGARIGLDLLSSGKFGTASVQELEPFSDSIITLFGSGSESLD